MQITIKVIIFFLHTCQSARAFFPVQPDFSENSIGYFSFTVTLRRHAVSFPEIAGESSFVPDFRCVTDRTRFKPGTQLESADIKTLLTSIRLSFSYHVLRPVSLLSSTDGHPPSIYRKFLETLSVGTKGARGKTNTCYRRRVAWHVLSARVA